MVVYVVVLKFKKWWRFSDRDLFLHVDQLAKVLFVAPDWNDLGPLEMSSLGAIEKNIKNWQERKES